VFLTDRGVEDAQIRNEDDDESHTLLKVAEECPISASMTTDPRLGDPMYI
jgi:hypothetical protein